MQTRQVTSPSEIGEEQRHAGWVNGRRRTSVVVLTLYVIFFSVITLSANGYLVFYQQPSHAPSPSTSRSFAGCTFRTLTILHRFDASDRYHQYFFRNPTPVLLFTLPRVPARRNTHRKIAISNHHPPFRSRHHLVLMIPVLICCVCFNTRSLTRIQHPYKGKVLLRNFAPAYSSHPRHIYKTILMPKHSFTSTQLPISIPNHNLKTMSRR
jgi:hypothetical protein